MQHLRIGHALAKSPVTFSEMRTPIIGGSITAINDKVQTRHWDQFAEGVGLAKAQAKKRVLALAKSLPLAARRLQSDPGRGFADNPVVERIIALIEQRCALTVRRLTDPAADGENAAEQSP